MKFIATLIFISVFSCAVSSNETEPIRQFLTNFFQTVNGTQWTLNEDCLAGVFDADLYKIRTALKAKDYIIALFYLYDLKRVILNFCPIQELNEVGNQITLGITSGKVADNIMTNYMEIITLMNEILPHFHEYDLPKIGTLLGRIYNVVIIGKIHNLEFLAYGFSPIDSNPIDFIVGFIEGTSEVNYDENQCIKESRPYLPELANSVEAIWQAISTKHGINDAFVQFMGIASKLKVAETNCHFIYLANSFLSLSNPITVAKISLRIIRNVFVISSLITDIKRAYKEENIRILGRDVGRLFHIMFLYSTQ
jgi:hypothetical protein